MRNYSLKVNIHMTAFLQEKDSQREKKQFSVKNVILRKI